MRITSGGVLATCGAAWVLACCAGTVQAQWVQQQFELVEGWNSIFVQVDPQPARADDLFAGLPLASVWARVAEPLAALVEACDGPNDADCTPSTDTQWRVWLPPGSTADTVNSLRIIAGGQVYLIQATAPTTLTLVGRPNGVFRRWVPGPNLAGFYVVDDEPGTPTFEQYFAPEAVLGDAQVYAIQSDGGLNAVAKNTQIAPGVGYWVSSAGTADYDGPLSIDRSTLRGVDFAKRSTTHTMELNNLANVPRDISLAYQSSAPVPAMPASLPDNAGDVPVYHLDYGEGDKVEDILKWSGLTSLTLPIPPDDLETPSTSLRIGIRRTGLAGAILDNNLEGSQYQGVLRLTDGAGFQRRVGVVAEVFPSTGTAAAGNGQTARPGLYLGFVKVDRVSWVTAGARITTNQDPAAPAFAGLKRCFDGANDGASCAADRRRCVGSPEIELQSLVCSDNSDCPTGGTCEIVTDCPDGNCAAFCIGGDNEGDACSVSVDCAGQGLDGVCSADLNDTVVRPTPHPLEFPVILHLSDGNTYRLLTEVTLLATDDRKLVLATPECDPELCEGLSGALTVNGRPFARRVSTAAFSFAGDLEFDEGGSFSTSLAASTTIAGNDPLNPFKHKFHPDHDCVDADGQPAPGECFELTRSFIFSFDPDPPDGVSVLDWGDSQLGGVYSEQVTGLHREPISAQGRFELRRVSDVPRLNTPYGTGAAQ